MPTRVLLVGAGAIGAFYGSRLATLADVAVSALCRSNYAAVAANGFRVTSPKHGDTLFRPEFTFASPDEAASATSARSITWDFLVVATKALPDVSDDSTLLHGLVAPSTALVLVQNGVGVEHPYRARFPLAPILSAVTIASCAQPEPGLIRHNRWTRISIGPYLPHLDDGGRASSEEADSSTAAAADEAATAVATRKTNTLVSLLHRAGISDAEPYSHAALQFVRWHKVAINAAMNPTSVLCGGAPNAAMAADPELARHLAAVMHEVIAAAPVVLGRPFPPGLASPDHILASTRRNDSGSRPSMWSDWEAGKRMELEVILGNPIRLAREKGVEMPRVQAMYALLKTRQERRERGGKESKF